MGRSARARDWPLPAASRAPHARKGLMHAQPHSSTEFFMARNAMVVRKIDPAGEAEADSGAFRVHLSGLAGGRLALLFKRHVEEIRSTHPSAVVVGGATGAEPRPAAPKVTTPEGTVRPRHRRRLLPGQLHAVRRLPEEARRAVRPHDRSSTSARPRKAGPSSPPSSRRPRTTRSCRRSRRPTASSRWPKASPTTRRGSSRETARRSSGSTAACTRPRCSARSS